MSVFVFPDLRATPKARKAQVKVGTVGTLDPKAWNIFLTIVAVVFDVEFADPGTHFGADFHWDLFVSGSGRAASGLITGRSGGAAG